MLLSSEEILATITLPEAAAAVEQAFLAWADGELGEPESLGLRAGDGTFHVKACASRAIFVAKTNANYPGNPARGLPTIQGVVAVFAVADGRLLMLLDSPAVTNLRTAATTTTAIRHLAPASAREAAIIGCGALGRVHAQALRECLGFDRLLFFDADTLRGSALAAWARESLGVETVHCPTVREATFAAKVVVTCTSSHQAFLDIGDVTPGTLVAGVGADNPQKAELTPALLAGARLVDAGVRGELARAIRAQQRVGPGERVVFRSTGLAIEDLALATLLAAKRGIDCG
jgi:ornithine cyclodeaminase/alanine dehydrogenase-like protein (mu-crystallin family)